MERETLLPSELIEPLIVRTVGRLFQEYQHRDTIIGSNKVRKKSKERTLTAAKRFWQGMRTLATLLDCNGAIHAKICMQNEMRDLARALEVDTGEHPVRDKWDNWYDR